MEGSYAGISQGSDSPEIFLTALRTQEKRIIEATQEKFGQIVSVTGNAVSTIFAMLLCCAGDDKYPKLDKSGQNRKHAVVLKMMRHARQGADLGLQIVDLTLRGHYYIALSLVRILLEEAIKASFYATFPDEAMKHLSTGSKEGKERDYLDMAERLGWDHQQVDRFAGGLSKFVHAAPLASLTASLLPEFNEKYSYVALVNTARQLYNLLLAVAKVFSDEIMQNPVLSLEVAKLFEAFKHIRESIDPDLDQLEILIAFHVP